MIRNEKAYVLLSRDDHTFISILCILLYIFFFYIYTEILQDVRELLHRTLHRTRKTKSHGLSQWAGLGDSHRARGEKVSGPIPPPSSPCSWSPPGGRIFSRVPTGGREGGLVVTPAPPRVCQRGLGKSFGGAQTANP